MRTKTKKSVVAADLTAAWDRALSQYVTDDIDAVRADGWLSCGDIAERRKIPEQTMRAALQRAIDAGQMERRQFRVRLRDLVAPVWFYRPTQA